MENQIALILALLIGGFIGWLINVAVTYGALKFSRRIGKVDLFAAILTGLISSGFGILYLLIKVASLTY